MRISDLTEYAAEKYHISEEHKWSDFPGFSVLCHPETGKWVALVIRQWNEDLGEEIERCDIKYSGAAPACSYLSAPFRMHAGRWIGVVFNETTDPDVIFSIFDRAVAEGAPSGFKITLASQLLTEKLRYSDTAIPFSDAKSIPSADPAPLRIREMRRLYEYGRESLESKARNFYNQALFMYDFEDDYEWTGDFNCYFPTYHDLTTNQLRGYFSWRSQVRKGVFRPIPVSAAYIYIYELINGIGADSPEDAVSKLRAFEKGYIDAGFGNPRMRVNLRSWTLDYIIINGLPKELAIETFDSDTVNRDAALSVLKNPSAYSDNDVFDALCAIGGKKTSSSPVVTVYQERGKRLFAESWRAASEYKRDEKTLFRLCFGKKTTCRWLPLANAVYYNKNKNGNTDYIINDARYYRCRNGEWSVTSYSKALFDRELLSSFLRETDALLRRYLKTGRYLKEDAAAEWAIPFVNGVIKQDQTEIIEASRQIISIDLSGLDKIRTDAMITRDSLLTDEEIEEETEYTQSESSINDSSLPLDSVQVQILKALIKGEDADPIIKDARLMPSIAADFINESLFDEIGDSVVICENNKLSVVEDYIEDLERLLGGCNND